MGKEFLRVTKCCYCVPLRLASLLIGYFSIVASCVTIAMVCFSAYKVVAYVDHATQQPSPEHTPAEVETTSQNLYISLGYYVLVFVYNIAINVMLVIGVHKNKPDYLKAYVRTSYLLVVLATVLVVLTCIFMGWFFALPTLKWAFTVLMCMMIVRSTYLEMEEQKNPRSIEMQNLYIDQRAPMVA